MFKINLIFVFALLAFFCAGCLGPQDKAGNSGVRVSGDMTISAGTREGF